MNSAQRLFGLFIPGDSWLHRLGVGWKYLLLLALTLPELIVQVPWFSLAMLSAAMVVLASARVPLGLAWGLPLALWTLLGVMLGYHLIVGSWPTGVMVVANLSAAVYAGRMLTLTTPAPVLIDALVAGVRPLRFLGLDPERVGLAVAIMVRSIPHLLTSFGEVREAARARGLERRLLAQMAPVVVRTVAFAQATGDALAARGLGDEASPEPRGDALG